MEFFRPSVIEAVLLCVEHGGFENSTLTPTEVLLRLEAAGLRSNLAYASAAALIEKVPSVIRLCTDDPSESYRNVLQRMIEELRPAWARVAVYGREHVKALAPPNAVQCLEAGGLMGEPTRISVSWWTGLASMYRTSTDDAKVRAGQEAEFKSLIFETKRLDAGTEPRLLPKLVSIDDSCIGYDVESYLSADDPSPLFIEVKSSKSGSQFFLTRNEWDTLRVHPSRAVVHFWEGTEASEPMQIPVSELVRHVPSDNGSGQWELVKVNVSMPPVISITLS